jgi:hypothetical protein
MSNVNTNTRKKRRRTYLWDLNTSHGDFSDDDEKRQPRRNDTFLYQRRVRQPTDIRGLADLPGRKAMRSHYPTFPNEELVRPGWRQSLAGE